MNRAELLVRLQRVQQLPQMQGRNIRSIAAVLSTEALLKHVEVCEAQAEKAALQGVGTLRSDLNEARIDADRALREGRYEDAARISYERIPDIEKRLADAESFEQSDERLRLDAALAQGLTA